MFQLSFLKVSVFLLSIFFILEAGKKFFLHQKNQTFLKFFVQVTVWTGISALVFFPKLAQTISLKIGFGESLNTFIFLGFVFVFLILFKIISLVERIEQNISEIVRKEALEKITKKTTTNK